MSEGKVTNEKEVEARRWEDSELDTTEGVVTFEHGTVNLPMWAEGRWKDVPLSTVLAAYASSREAANAEELKRYRALDAHLPAGYAIGDDATAELAVELAANEKLIAELVDTLEMVLASAFPNKREHPTMYKAWGIGKDVLLLARARGGQKK